MQFIIKLINLSVSLRASQTNKQNYNPDDSKDGDKFLNNEICRINQLIGNEKGQDVEVVEQLMQD
jgi:hypothetical protein